jgi:predicted permease
MLEQWRHDFRLAWRGLRATPIFTIAAALTLALGIAGTTVMFALVRGVLLRPLPFPEQDRLVAAWSETDASRSLHWPFRVADIETLGAASRTFEAVAGVGYNGAVPTVVIEDGSASYIRVTPVSGNFFSVLRVQPVLGRAFNAADDVTGAERTLVLSYRLWQRRYGGAADVIGRSIVLHEQAFTIIGVMPPDVEYPQSVEAWVTVAGLTMTNAAFRVDVDTIARLAPGVTIEQASSELGALLLRLESVSTSTTPFRLRPVVRRYSDVIAGDVRFALLALFGAVAMVLLIASANAANLWLLRGESRRAELAVRTALGATRSRLARQLVAESLSLAPAAAALGLVVAWWSLPVLVRFAPTELPRIDVIGIDAFVAAFAVLTAVAGSALAGLAPAVLFTDIDPANALRGQGRVISGTARFGRRALVVAQVALAVATVAAAGLLVRSLLRLQDAETGLAAERLLFVQMQLPRAKYQDRGRHLQFLDQVVSRLEASPGIAGATPVTVPPFAGTAGWDLPRFTAEGQDEQQVASNPSLNLESVHPTYFTTFGVRLVRGRTFTAADRDNAPNVAIVSEDVAARTWPGEDPIGKRIKFGGVDSKAEWRTVVGVATLTRYRELVNPRPTIYLPAEQFIVAAQMIVLQTTVPPIDAVALVRDRVQAIDPDIRIVRTSPFTEMLAAPLARPRFNAFLIVVFGGVALVLATIGLYAVVASSVRQRYREIGIRVALGARASDVRGLVLSEGMTLSATGAAIGLLIAIVAGRALTRLLFEIQPLDAPTLAAAAVLLLAVSAIACYLPARRAQRVDAAVMLRSE